MRLVANGASAIYSTRCRVRSSPAGMEVLERCSEHCPERAEVESGVDELHTGAGLALASPIRTTGASWLGRVEVKTGLANINAFMSLAARQQAEWLVISISF